MKLRIFLDGLHQLDELEDEVNHFFTEEGLDPDELVGYEALSPDRGEIALVFLYEED